MKAFRYILAPLYHFWFYILVTIVTILMFPILVISILRQSWYPVFFAIARIWSTVILYGMGCVPKIKRDVVYQKGKSYLFVANHTSMLDIMTMFYTAKNPFVFVGKKELARLPFFGFIYKRTCILVDRGNSKSRVAAFRTAEKRLAQGLSVCIFPEGGVPDDFNLLLDQFKDGAFRLALEHRIPIAPMTFHDNKKRLPYRFFYGGPGRIRVKVHPIIDVATMTFEDRKTLKTQTRELILNELQNPTV